MRLKIISGGSGRNTEIVNMETGERLRLENCIGVEWKCKWDSFSEATITLRNVPVEVEVLDQFITEKRDDA